MDKNPDSHSKTRSPNAELLGQKFYLPDSNIQLVGFIAFLICTTIISTYIIKHDYTIEKRSDGWAVKSGVIDDNLSLSEGFILSFWTPSDSTKFDIDLNNKEDTLKYGWQINKKSYKTANIEFGSRLKNRFGFSGYRRTPVVGEGDDNLKRGWWWSVGVNSKFNDNFIKKFKKVYIEFWCPDAKWDELYIEIVGNQKD